MDKIVTLHSESEHLLQGSQSDDNVMTVSQLVSKSSEMFEQLSDELETYHDAIWRDACSQLLDVECNRRQAVNNLKRP